ncbi:MAG: hypothetical protein M0Z31_03675 [Clostridia bacterium]|nr:hypothetical protein [Clostridia bacterium]
MTLEPVIRFLDRYDLPWVLLALMTWLAILLTCSRKEFWRGLPVGLWTMVIGGALEQFFIHHKFWAEDFIMIKIGELDLFLIIGPFFTIGVLLVRFLPESRWGKFLAVLAWSGFATLIEMGAIKFGFLDYHPVKWGMEFSIATYYLALMSALGFYFSLYDRPKAYL